jgi:hypothetical protein
MKAPKRGLIDVAAAIRLVVFIVRQESKIITPPKPIAANNGMDTAKVIRRAIGQFFNVNMRALARMNSL